MKKQSFFICVIALILASCYPFNLSLKPDLTNPHQNFTNPDPIILGPGEYKIVYADGTEAGPFNIPILPDTRELSGSDTGKIIKSIFTKGKDGEADIAEKEILIGRPDTDNISLNIKEDGTLAFRPGTGGDGFIPIGSYAEFQLINSTEYGPNQYRQEADLDFMDIEWTPIGNNTTKFTGTFDGNDKHIDKLKINQPTEDYIGLFGVIAGSSTIENVHISSGSVTGNQRVGGVVGASNNSTTTISLCSNAANINGENYIGGIVGINGADVQGGTVSSCYNTGNITGSISVGGVVGRNDVGRVVACYNKGKVASYTPVGGGIGGVLGTNNFGYLVASYNTGEVSAYDGTNDNNDAGVGGVVGCSWAGESTACYNIGSVTRLFGNSSYFGGVLGFHTGDSYRVYDNYWLDVPDDNAENGIASFASSGPGPATDTNAAPFSAADWPSTETNAQWGIGGGSGDGTYWQSLGGWNDGNPVYPKLWFEQ